MITLEFLEELMKDLQESLKRPYLDTLSYDRIEAKIDLLDDIIYEAKKEVK